MWRQADHTEITLQQLVQYGWIVKNDTVTFDWESEKNVSAVQEHVNRLLKGCKCKTGCGSKRCGCKGKDWKCCIGCEFVNCTNTDADCSSSSTWWPLSVCSGRGQWQLTCTLWTVVTKSCSLYIFLAMLYSKILFYFINKLLTYSIAKLKLVMLSDLEEFFFFLLLTFSENVQFSLCERVLNSQNILVQRFLRETFVVHWPTLTLRCQLKAKYV